MAIIFSASALATKALERVGTFGVNMASPTPAQVSRTMNWMDLVVSSFADEEECQWLRRRECGFVLRDGVATYDIEDELAADSANNAEIVARQIASVAQVKVVETTSGREVCQVDRIDANQFDLLNSNDTNALPDKCFIDRIRKPSIHLYPKPAGDNVGNYRVEFVLFIYPTDNRFDDDPAGNTIDIPPSWQMWLIDATAHKIGNGPVTRLSTADLNSLERDMERNRARLLAQQNRVKDDQGHVQIWEY